MNNFISTFFSLQAGYLILFLAAAFFLFLLGFFTGILNNKSKIKAERADAVKRSRAVLNGQLGEQIAPFLPDFPSDPAEIRFIGKPVDYIAFNGASEGFITDITFIEIKTGNSALSPVERSLKDAINAGRVKYTEYRVNLKNN